MRGTLSNECAYSTIKFQSGMGLMKCGNVEIPFDNTIKKGTDLYNLYNTNIHEKIAMGKSKNAVDND